MKQVFWFSGALEAIRDEFPEPVKQEAGYAIHLAQLGLTHGKVKPLKGFPGIQVQEFVGRHDNDAYRVIYTATIGNTVYVLHAFQKKSKHGIATPKPDMDKVKTRLKQAKELEKETRS